MIIRKKRTEFALCIADQAYEDLNDWKVYRVLADEKAARVGCIRVIDESGEDYLYPADRFVAVDIPKDVRARLPRRRPGKESDRTLPMKARSGRRLNVN